MVRLSWPHSLCSRLWIELSGLEPWPGTLCRFLGQERLLSYSSFLHPGVLMGTSEFNAGGEACHGLAFHPGRSEYPQSLYVTETGINSGLMGHLVHIQTLPTLTSTQNASKQGKQIVISLLFSQG